MEIEYELTKDDLVEFNLYSLAKSLKVNNRIWKSISLIIIVIVVFTLTVHLISKDAVYTGIDLIFLSVFIYLHWFYFSNRGMRKRIVRVIEKLNDIVPNDDICRHKVSISNDGLTDSTDYDRITAFWHGVREIKQSDKYLYLSQTKAKAFIVPKRAFPDEASFNQFAQAARDFHAKALNEKPKS